MISRAGERLFVSDNGRRVMVQPPLHKLHAAVQASPGSVPCTLASGVEEKHHQVQAAWWIDIAGKSPRGQATAPTPTPAPATLAPSKEMNVERRKARGRRGNRRGRKSTFQQLSSLARRGATGASTGIWYSDRMQKDAPLSSLSARFVRTGVCQTRVQT